MSLLDTVNRIQAHQPQPFVAPVPDAKTVTLFTLQAGIPYHFRLLDPEPGWWLAEPHGRRVALLRQGRADEYLPYLSQLPRFYCLTTMQLSRSVWLVVPANASDAAQRRWAGAKPRQLHLCRHELKPLWCVSARQMADTLLYEDRALTRLSLPPVDVLRATKMYEVRKKELEQTKRKVELEERADYLLGMAGAKLIGWEKLRTNYRVTWEHQGFEYTMEVGRDMHILSAGICLAGTDQDHDLATIVGTMQEARRLRRFDLPREHRRG